jgi:hypothetical protein
MCLSIIFRYIPLDRVQNVKLNFSLCFIKRRGNEGMAPSSPIPKSGGIGKFHGGATSPHEKELAVPFSFSLGIRQALRLTAAMKSYFQIKHSHKQIHNSDTST